jgi:hypothetical protein
MVGSARKTLSKFTKNDFARFGKMAKHVTQRNSESADDAIDAKIERGKHIALVLVALFFNIAFVGYCLHIVLAQVGSTDDIKWATSILTAIVGGLLGYLISMPHRGGKI